MDKNKLDALESLFLALSDRTRLRLLMLMAGGQTSVGELANALGDSQPKVSRHLAYLRSAGLVMTQREGKWVYYGVAVQSDETVDRVLNAVLDAGRLKIVEPENADRPNIYAETYDDDWRPADMDVFLL